MKVTSVAGVKVYDLSQGKNLPTFLTEKARRNLAKDPEFARRIELLQDFSFQAYSRTVRVSRDGRYILASGGYKPHIKMFDVAEVSMKFERYVDSDIIRAEILSDDFQKLCLMLEDRTLQFHSKFGQHHSLRLPVIGRDISIDRETCDMYIATSSRSILRFNMMEGRFRQSWETSQTEELSTDEGNNAVVWNQYHRLVAAAGQDGYVRLWDPRQRAEVASLNVRSVMGDDENEKASATALQYEPSESGLQFIVGTSHGLCSVYDLRSSRSILQKEHQYGTAIKSIKFKKHQEDHAPIVVTCDSKQMKGWNYSNGSTLFNIESKAPLQEINVAPVSKLEGDTSGLIFACGDQEKVSTYFVPSLGPAPVWASFLEGLTEELEEKDNQVFDDYRFVTKEELIDAGLSQLMESSATQLRPWMHGYFIESKTFEKLRAAVAHSKLPSAHEARKQKSEEKKAQRIVLSKKVKINPDLADKAGGSLLKDDRFKDLFENPAFKVDTESMEYKHMFPAGRKKAQLLAKGSDDEDEEEGEEEKPAMVAQKLNNKITEPARKSLQKQQVPRQDERTESLSKRRTMVVVKANGPGKKSSLLDDEQTEFSEDPVIDAEEKAKRGTPMLKRLQVEKAKDDNVVDINTSSTGEMSITFVPKSDIKKQTKRGGRFGNKKE